MKHWCFGSQGMQERTLSSFPMLGSSWKSNLWGWGSSITSGYSFRLERGCIDGFKRSGRCWFPSWCLWQSKRPSMLRDLASQSSMICLITRWVDGPVCWWLGCGWAEKWVWKIGHIEVYLSIFPVILENSFYIVYIWAVRVILFGCSQLCRSKLCTPLRGGRQTTHENVAKMQRIIGLGQSSWGHWACLP